MLMVFPGVLQQVSQHWGSVLQDSCLLPGVLLLESPHLSEVAVVSFLSFLNLLRKSFMCVGVLPMCLYLMCMQCMQRPEEDQIPGNWRYTRLWATLWAWKLNSGPLDEQPVFWTTVLSLWPPPFLIITNVYEDDFHCVKHWLNHYETFKGSDHTCPVRIICSLGLVLIPFPTQ